jgi:hypothetical protein
MKPRLYLESTIPSYLVARPSRDVILAGQQKCTRDWWSKRASQFEIFVSEVVVEEVSYGEVAMAARRIEIIRHFIRLDGNDRAKVLTNALIHGGPLPQKAARNDVCKDEGDLRGARL